jgi:isoleucyl-tRNA synthetase
MEEVDILVGVKKTIPAELALEGLARDIVRRIQDQRKRAGFNIDDRILVYYQGGPKNCQAFSAFNEYIAAETLAVEMKCETPPKTAHIAEYELTGEKLAVGIEKVSKSSNS